MIYFRVSGRDGERQNERNVSCERETSNAPGIEPATEVPNPGPFSAKAARAQEELLFLLVSLSPSMGWVSDNHRRDLRWTVGPQLNGP